MLSCNAMVEQLSYEGFPPRAHFKSTWISSHVKDGVVADEVEEPLIPSSHHVGFGDFLFPLRGF